MDYGENELDRAEEIIRRHFSRVIGDDSGIGWALGILLQASADVKVALREDYYDD